jgi:5-methylcytosine-specific restriction endonuclease McrA
MGETFTMEALRAKLGSDGVPERAEHLNRRLRRLRDNGWIITSPRDDRTLPRATYRLDGKGRRLWLGEREPDDSVSQRSRRLVLDRDGHRCTVCGIGRGERYPGEPRITATLTAGHRVPRERGGSNDIENLRTECARCNEPIRHEGADPESYDEVVAEVRGLKKDDLKSLLMWLESGERTRSKLDRAYDRVRELSPADRKSMLERVRKMLHGITSDSS